MKEPKPVYYVNGAADLETRAEFQLQIITDNEERIFDDLPPALAWMTGCLVYESTDALRILTTLGRVNQEIQDLAAEVERLEKQPRCDGWEHERPDGRLYAHHSVNSRCPYPGHATRPGASRGKRAYVRDDDVEAVREAMLTWKQWKQTKSQYWDKKRKLGRLRADLEGLNALCVRTRPRDG